LSVSKLSGPVRNSAVRSAIQKNKDSNLFPSQPVQPVQTNPSSKPIKRLTAKKWFFYFIYYMYLK